MIPSPPIGGRVRFGPVVLAALALLVAVVPCVSAQPLLLDPALQPKFVNNVPDALAPGFIYTPTDMVTYD